MKKLLPFLFLVSCSPKEVEEYNFGQCLDVSNTSIFKKAEAHEISRRSQLKIVSFHSNGGMGHGTGTYLTYKDESYIITAPTLFGTLTFLVLSTTKRFIGLSLLSSLQIETSPFCELQPFLTRNRLTSRK